LTKQIYTEIISNDYLEKKEEIKGLSVLEVKIRAGERLAGWAEEEKRLREREAIESKIALAEYDSHHACSQIMAYRNLFRDSMQLDPKLNWVALYNDTPFEPFVFREVLPTHKKVDKDMKVPAKSIWEIFLPARKEKRLSREEMAMRILKEKLDRHEERKAVEKRAYETARSLYLEKQGELNDFVDQLKFAYETGKPHGIEGYVRLVLAKSAYPGGVEKDFEVLYDKTGHTVIVNYLLPDINDLPSTTEYEYRAESDEIAPVEMETIELWDFYRSVLVQIAVRTIYEIFRSDYRKMIGNVGFNGWLISGGETGDREHAWSLITCKASRENYDKMDPEKGSPEEIFRELKGVMAKSPAMNDAVQPLVNILIEGSRFTEPL